MQAVGVKTMRQRRSHCETGSSRRIVRVRIRRNLSSVIQLLREVIPRCASVAITIAVAVAAAIALRAFNERIVYILSKGGSRHMANVAVRHSQPRGTVCKITIVDEPVVPSHAAR